MSANNEAPNTVTGLAEGYKNSHDATAILAAMSLLTARIEELLAGRKGRRK